MKRILILVAVNLLLCSTVSAAQGGGGETTKNGSSKKKTVTKKTPGTTPPRRKTPARRAPCSAQSPTQGTGRTHTVNLGRGLSLEMVEVPHGSFCMGSTNGHSDEKPVHQVTINHSFYMGKYEVTQAQWQTVMGSNPSSFKDCGGNCPVEEVSWNDVQHFIARLNGANDGYTYRLPTEAEWEYACRAGTNGDYAGDLDSMAWCYVNSGDAQLSGDWNFDKFKANNNRTHPVGTKLPNSFGLFDMHGNVFEWCQDWYHDSYDGAPTDGRAWLSGGLQIGRVLRGGSWRDNASILRSALRNNNLPDSPDISYGFRVVAVVRIQQVPTTPNPTPTNSTNTPSGSTGEKRLYRFSSDGCVFVEIHLGHAYFYPKGGEVIITPPSPVKAWRDKPGIVSQPQGDLPTGTYKICATDRNAWGVEVSN